jgi:glycosyltransferase 2 family protein
VSESQDISVSPPARGGHRVAYWIAALGLAAVLLYYSFRGIDWGEVWKVLRNAKPWAVGLAASGTAIAMFLRAVRWRVLLSSEGDVSVPSAFWATATGYLGNNVLPARAGEVIRTLMIASRSKLSRTFVLTTALSERVADAIALVIISAAVLLTLSERPGWLATAARPFAILGICGAAAIALLPAFEGLYIRILRRLPVPAGLREKVEHILGQALQGIRSFHDAGRLSRFLGLTCVIWCIDACTAFLCGRAMGIPLNIPVAFLLIAGIGLGSALPSTPGYVGIYEFVAVAVLTPFDISRNDAIACILLLRALGFSVILLFGLIGLAKHRRSAEAAQMALDKH